MASTAASRALPPGPSLPGPVQTVWYTFDQPGFFRYCRQRFGRTFTTRLPGFPPVVVTGQPEVARELFTGDPATRRHGNDLLKPLFGERSLMLLEPTEHLARRRLELPPFHGEAVRGYTDRIRQLTETEVAGWAPGSVIASQARAQELTMKVILELVLGVRDPRLRAQLAEIFESFQTRINNLALFAPEPLVRRSRWNPVAEPIYRRIDRLRDLLTTHIQSTRADPELAERPDVLALLVRARDEQGEALTDTDLRDELVTLVAAGHETTAAAIGWTCDLLAHHPRVAEQLRATLAAGDRDYVKATAKEVLRLRTVAYVSAARIPLEPMRVERWEVGPETMVLIDAQGLHQDPELFGDPDAFRPERFLDGAPAPYAYLPFGGGAHRCLGAALAMLELELFIETLAPRWRLVPVGPPAKPKRRGPILAPSNRGRVRVLAL